MAAGIPSIDPSAMQFIRSLQAPQGPAGITGGSGGMGMMMPFLAGLGFREFAGNIKKLADLAGGNRTQQNMERGLTGKNPNPVMAGHPSPVQPMGAPAPMANASAPAIAAPSAGAGVLPAALASLIGRSGIPGAISNALPPSLSAMVPGSPFNPANAASQLALVGALS